MIMSALIHSQTISDIFEKFQNENENSNSGLLWSYAYLNFLIGLSRFLKLRYWYFTDRSNAGLLLLIFYGVFFCLVFAMPLYASVYMCLVVTCWEMADLLALVCCV